MERIETAGHDRVGVKGAFKRGGALLPYPSPSPLKERGIRG
jgi:hypothetical protein